MMQASFIYCSFFEFLTDCVQGVEQLTSKLKISVRHSINVDPNLILSDITNDIDVSLVSFAGVFIAPHIDTLAVVRGLGGQFPFIGCTSLANYSKKTIASNFRYETVTVIYLMGVGDVRIGHLKDIKQPGCKYAAFSTRDPDLSNLLKSVECFGGIAADDWEFENASVFANGEVYTSGTVAADLSSVGFDFFNASGWSPDVNAPIATISEVLGSKVFRLGDKTAVEFYSDAVHSSTLFPVYPLRVLGRDVLRAPLASNEADGSVTFSGDLYLGENVVLTYATRNQVLNSFKALLYENTDKVKRSPFVFAVSCAARNQILADLSHKEYEMLRELNPSSVLIYLYGEFLPMDGSTKLENQNIVLGMVH